MRPGHWIVFCVSFGALRYMEGGRYIQPVKTMFHESAEVFSRTSEEGPK